MFHRSDDIETVLAELQAGIIPTSIFVKNLSEKKDTFANMDKEQARVMKRKWRKLKKKFGVRKCGISTASWKVRTELRREK